MVTFSSEDMLQKYLASQSKLSTMIHKPKCKPLCTKKDMEISKGNKEVIEKSLEPSPPDKESGSEYFPSTDSGR